MLLNLTVNLIKYFDSLSIKLSQLPYVIFNCNCYKYSCFF